MIELLYAFLEFVRIAAMLVLFAVTACAFFGAMALIIVVLGDWLFISPEYKKSLAEEEDNNG